MLNQKDSALQSEKCNIWRLAHQCDFQILLSSTLGICKGLHKKGTEILSPGDCQVMALSFTTLNELSIKLHHQHISAYEKFSDPLLSYLKTHQPHVNISKRWSHIFILVLMECSCRSDQWDNSFHVMAATTSRSTLKISYETKNFSGIPFFFFIVAQPSLYYRCKNGHDSGNRGPWKCVTAVMGNLLGCDRVGT